MVAGKTVCLMYHELELPGRKLCQAEEGYVRYIVGIQDFRHQLQVLREAHHAGISVTQMLAGAGLPSRSTMAVKPTCWRRLRC